MDREKYNLRIVLDIDGDTTFGDVRRFTETLKGMPDDMPVVGYEGMNLDHPTLFGYIDQTDGEHGNGEDARHQA